MQTCLHCGKPFTSQRENSTYCSKNCRTRASEERRPAKECSHCHKQKTIRARGLCNTCYRQWFRTYKETKHECTCKVCGRSFFSRDKNTTVCSRKCASNIAVESKKFKEHQVRQSSPEGRKEKQAQMKEYWSHQPRKPKPKPKLLTAEQREQRRLDKCSPLRRAWEEHDSAAFFKALKAKSIVDEQGCWNWQGHLKNGYAYASLSSGKGSQPLYRAALEMRYGRPLGTQAAHHQ